MLTRGNGAAVGTKDHYRGVGQGASLTAWHSRRSDQPADATGIGSMTSQQRDVTTLPDLLHGLSTSGISVPPRKRQQSEAEPEQRVTGFGEVVGGLTEQEATGSAVCRWMDLTASIVFIGCSAEVSPESHPCSILIPGEPGGPRSPGTTGQFNACAPRKDKPMMVKSGHWPGDR
jgi:hypothetical protein